MSELGRKSGIASRRLAEAIRTAKNAVADQAEASTDVRELELARLELLAQELKPVFDDVPIDDPQWDFALSTGLQPRLWIDATAHVAMARDMRTYQFVRDTRKGRTIIEESTDVNTVAYAVTIYIADRLLERVRLMEGEIVSYRGDGAPVTRQETKEIQANTTVSQADDTLGKLLSIIWFLMGAFIACGLLYLWFGDRIKAFFVQ